MKKNKLLLLLFLFSVSLSAQVNTGPPCSATEYRQFDFWLGDWVVYDSAGAVVGENFIVPMQDGCLIQENWKSDGSTGTSYNFYNTQDSTWNQLWVDNQGTILKLKGHFEQGKMILKSELIPGKKVDYYYNQISWEKRPDGSVRQLWQVFAKSGKLLNTPFDGIYRLRKPER
jgi:hypothetical protein